MENLRISVDQLLAVASGDTEQVQVLEAYRMFANSKGWLRRMEENIDRGLSAEAAVEKEQSDVRARMLQATDAYLRERLQDLDDLSNRLLRIITGQGQQTGADLPENPILVARNIGPGELLEYGRQLRGIVLEEGSVGSHAAIVARALAIPLVINAKRMQNEALNGDHIMVDGDQGIVHLRPDDIVVGAFRDKMAMQAQAQERYASIREKPAVTLCGKTIRLEMNAGLMADLPSARKLGRRRRGPVPHRTAIPGPQPDAQTPSSRRSTPACWTPQRQARGVPHARHRVGQGAALHEAEDEPNPALGWRAIRVGLDKPGVMRMQLQALLRAANGRPLSIMFPFIAQYEEYSAARAEVDKALARERSSAIRPRKLEIGAMLETPSLAFASKKFLRGGIPVDRRQ